jgi:hypothetical protein
LNAAEWFRLGFFMDFVPPVTLPSGPKSTYTRVLNTDTTSGCASVWSARGHFESWPIGAQPDRG